MKHAECEVRCQINEHKGYQPCQGECQMNATPKTDALQSKIDAWYEGDGREAEKLDEVYAQLRLTERAAA